MRMLECEGLSRLERIALLVADRYSVSQHDSCSAFDDWKSMEGEMFVTKSYSITSTGNSADAVVNDLWRKIKQSWPPGTFVIWRERPNLTLDEDGTVKGYVRLGAFIEPNGVDHE